jgi:hypothetical protein
LPDLSAEQRDVITAAVESKFMVCDVERTNHDDDAVVILLKAMMM